MGNIYQNIIINRNPRWLEKIEQLFQLGENLMIIVGGGHVGGPDGPDGLVRLLTDKGYQIVQFVSTSSTSVGWSGFRGVR